MKKTVFFSLFIHKKITTKLVNNKINNLNIKLC